MNQLQFTQNIQDSLTIISNDFIDRYMLKADGEFVKIYLLLLRLVNQGAYTGPDQLADMLEITQKDVMRALNYWEKAGLISPQDSPKKEENLPASTQKISPVLADLPPKKTVPDKSPVTPKDMTDSIVGTDLEQTIYMAETYIGRPLSQTEITSFYYIDRQLHFPADLLEYLVEYCVTKGKKSIRYMESVAINWYQQNIDTVKKAKEESAAYTQNVFPVMKAFGISNRNPVSSEVDYIRQWNGLGFDTDILVEACNRTMIATHQASFPYADRILREWKKQGVKSMKDIQSLDKNFRSAKAAAKPNANNAGPANSFHNFDQRSYDYDDLEARLLDITNSSN